MGWVGKGKECKCGRVTIILTFDKVYQYTAQRLLSSMGLLCSFICHCFIYSMIGTLICKREPL